MVLIDTVPNTSLTRTEAKARLDIAETDRTLLFFGNIAAYKGLHCLVAAFLQSVRGDGRYRLIIAGRPKGSDEYWKEIQNTISRAGVGDRIVQRIEYVPDEETELYFKAADVLILPYTQIFQSGVLLLGYAFGLPVIAADVGSLREEIVIGETGYVFKSEDPLDLANVIRRYFGSDLFREIELRRNANYRICVRTVFLERKVAVTTKAVYTELVG